MRKVLGLSFVFVIILLFIVPLVYAEEATTSLMKKTKSDATNPQRMVEKQAIINQLKAEKKASREAIKEEKKGTVAENRKNNVQKRFNFRIQHLEAAIHRLENIAARFETRLGKIGATRDVAAARTNLALAKTHIQQAKDTLEKLKSAFTSVFSSDTPKQTYETAVKPLVEELFKQLSEAHQTLKMGVGTIKPTVTPKVIASPTEEILMPATVAPAQ